MLGSFVGWHQRDVDVLASCTFVGRYVPIPEWLQTWEIPSGFCASLGPSLWYLASWLIIDGGLPLWMVAVVEWIASVAMFPVWEAHNTWQLWFCSPCVLHSSKTFPLQGIFGAIIQIKILFLH